MFKFIEFIKRVEEIRENARLAEHSSLFINEFNKFKNTRARMLDSNYHTFKYHFCSASVNMTFTVQ